jgi:hypothetical protein
MTTDLDLDFSLEQEFRISHDGRLIVVDYDETDGEPVWFEDGGNEIFDFWMGEDPSGASSAIWYDKALASAKAKPVLDTSNLTELKEGDSSLLSHPENFEFPLQWDLVRGFL